MDIFEEDWPAFALQSEIRKRTNNEKDKNVSLPMLLEQPTKRFVKFSISARVKQRVPHQLSFAKSFATKPKINKFYTRISRGRPPRYKTIKFPRTPGFSSTTSCKWKMILFLLGPGHFSGAIYMLNFWGGGTAQAPYCIPPSWRITP